MKEQLALNIDSRPSGEGFDALLPDEKEISSGPPAVYQWDIPHTISELSYLTHNFYRYYGKFPPTMPRKLLRDFPPKRGAYVLDNFGGSGTTLVEAKLAGYPSIAVDISPLAALAARVKSQHHDLEKVDAQRRTALRMARSGLARATADSEDESDAESARVLGKWFTLEAQAGLRVLKKALLSLPPGREREFLMLAYLAIVRRVSRAYDGEVRPHINPSKPERDVLDAFERKTGEMLKRAAEYQAITDGRLEALAVAADCRELSTLPELAGKPVGLVVSHPPYLNCFDYVPVYKLEYQWATGIPELGDWDYRVLRRSELRSWPATDENVLTSYFDGLKRSFEQVREVSVKGARCCVVLGDCTVHGKVVRVIDRLIEMMESIGFETERIIYRTTHYGTGKYAYAGRADYHGEAAEKRDGVTVFRAP